MADIIKSAQEIAMEKIARLGEASEEERRKWKNVPAGEKLATKYLKEDTNLVAELSHYPEADRKYVVEGAAGVLIRNLGLPKNDALKKMNRRIMDGLKVMKSDKVAVENAFSRIRRVFDHYASQGEQQRRQAYQQLKVEFGAKLQQAVKKQMGPYARTDNIDVERQPQFQEEWRRAVAQLDGQYQKLLDEYKQELEKLP